jgi:multidrug efflux pump subunit AcrB
VPSEDQSRFVVHIISPVGSSIHQVDELLQECESGIYKDGVQRVHGLVNRDDVAGILTTVATEPGQLINEADIFVQLLPQHLRKKRQQRIMQEVRADLEKIHDIRVIVRDQSTEGFTAQRGDPIDFAIQGDWNRLPALATTLTTEMRRWPPAVPCRTSTATTGPACPKSASIPTARSWPWSASR